MTHVDIWGLKPEACSPLWAYYLVCPAWQSCIKFHGPSNTLHVCSNSVAWNWLDISDQDNLQMVLQCFHCVGGCCAKKKVRKGFASFNTILCLRHLVNRTPLYDTSFRGLNLITTGLTRQTGTVVEPHDWVSLTLISWFASWVSSSWLNGSEKSVVSISWYC